MKGFLQILRILTCVLMRVDRYRHTVRGLLLQRLNQVKGRLRPYPCTCSMQRRCLHRPHSTLSLGCCWWGQAGNFYEYDEYELATLEHGHEPFTRAAVGKGKTLPRQPGAAAMDEP